MAIDPERLGLRVKIFAPAKVNLFLHVGEKQPSGYHDLMSLVAFARTGDALSIAPADALSLTLAGPFGAVLAVDSDNLVLKAARALANAKGVREGAAITLTKNLPVASGIGGGSADAAACLRGLCKVWGIAVSQEELCAIGLSIGADVPVCVGCAPCWMEGRGERVTPLTRFPEIAAVLVNPGAAVPTGPVFGALRSRRGTGGQKPEGFADFGALLSFLSGTCNDLETPARALAPAVGDVLDVLSRADGVRLARMSGSGATCFALFDEEGTAARAAVALKAAHPAWWVAQTQLASCVLGAPCA